MAVHGLGGSHVNWAAVGPRLAEHHRVYAPDLAGHGLTRPDHRRADVHSNQQLLDRFVREVSGAPVVLMGNSMGGLISILQASKHPESVAGVVLLDPSIPAPLLHRPDPQVLLRFVTYTIPGLGAAVLSRSRHVLTPAQQVQRVLDLCCVDPGRVPPDVVERAVELARQRRSFAHVNRAFIAAARSIVAIHARRRAVGAHMRAIRAPVLLLQGEEDRLVPAAAARMAARDNPTWTVEIAPGIGHVPQLEAPDWTVDTYLRWREAAPIGVPATRSGG